MRFSLLTTLLLTGLFSLTATGQTTISEGNSVRGGVTIGMVAKRTWTARNGRSVEARLDRADVKNITLQLADGFTTVPVALLSDDDRQLLKSIFAQRHVQTLRQMSGVNTILVGLDDKQKIVVRLVRMKVGNQTARALRTLSDLKSLKYAELATEGSVAAALAPLSGLSNLESLRVIKLLSLVGPPHLDEEESTHLSKMHQLKQLSAYVSDDGARYLSKLKNLRHLKLDKSPIGTAGLAHLKDLVKLESLTLKHTRINDASLKHLRPLKKLRKIDLLYTRVTDDGMKHLSGHNELEEIWLNSDITHRGLQHLKDLPNLKTIVRSANWQHDDGELETLRAFQLPELVVQGNYFTSRGLAYLNEYQHLKTLTLHSGQLGDGALANINALKKLDSLAISIRLAGPGLQHLAPLRGLRRLQLFSHRRFDDSQLVHLAKLLNLEHLELTCVPQGARTAAGSPKRRPATGLSNPPYGKGLSHLRGLKNLRMLIIPGDYLSDEGWQQLSSLQQLKSLIIGGAVTDDEFAHIARLRNLESLEIRANQLTDASAASIAKLTRLKRLMLEGSGLGDEAAKAMASLAQLSEIDISSSRVTDAGLQALADLPQLRRLLSGRVRMGPDTIRILREKHPFLMLSPGRPAVANGALR